MKRQPEDIKIMRLIKFMGFISNKIKGYVIIVLQLPYFLNISFVQYVAIVVA